MMTYNELLDRARAEAAVRPDMGRTVKVVKGRKVPVGTTGVVVYNALHNIVRYGRVVRVVRRIGIKDASGAVHFTAADNAVAV